MKIQSVDSRPAHIFGTMADVCPEVLEENHEEADSIATFIIGTLTSAFEKREGRKPNSSEVEEMLSELTESRIQALLNGEDDEEEGVGEGEGEGEREKGKDEATKENQHDDSNTNKRPIEQQQFFSFEPVKKTKTTTRDDGDTNSTAVQQSDELEISDEALDKIERIFFGDSKVDIMEAGSGIEGRETWESGGKKQGELLRAFAKAYNVSRNLFAIALRLAPGALPDWANQGCLSDDEKTLIASATA
jgi:hypothetical protein